MSNPAPAFLRHPHDPLDGFSLGDASNGYAEETRDTFLPKQLRNSPRVVFPREALYPFTASRHPRLPRLTRLAQKILKRLCVSALKNFIKDLHHHSPTPTQNSNSILQLETPTRTPARKPAFIATLNVDFVANAVSGWPFGGNDELWGYLRNADFVTADGMPIVLLSKLLRRALPERVTGADMVPRICRRCAEEGLSVYVLGGDREAIEEAFGKMGLDGHSTADNRQPDVDCRMSNVKKTILAGIDPAFVKLDEDQPEIIERINAAKPDILFVALGNPKQELWMGRNAVKLDVGAMIGIGGTFNFLNASSIASLSPPST